MEEEGLILKHFVDFLANIDWFFGIVFTLIIYGVKEDNEFQWYRDMFKTEKMVKLKLWVTGLILIIAFTVSRLYHNKTFSFDYMLSLTQTFLVVMIFRSLIFDKISEKLKGKKPEPPKEEPKI